MHLNPIFIPNPNISCAVALALHSVPVASLDVGPLPPARSFLAMSCRSVWLSCLLRSIESCSFHSMKLHVLFALSLCFLVLACPPLVCFIICASPPFALSRHLFRCLLNPSCRSRSTNVCVRFPLSLSSASSCVAFRYLPLLGLVQFTSPWLL